MAYGPQAVVTLRCLTEDLPPPGSARRGERPDTFTGLRGDFFEGRRQDAAMAKKPDQQGAKKYRVEVVESRTTHKSKGGKSYPGSIVTTQNKLVPEPNGELTERDMWGLAIRWTPPIDRMRAMRDELLEWIAENKVSNDQEKNTTAFFALKGIECGQFAIDHMERGEWELACHWIDLARGSEKFFRLSERDHAYLIGIDKQVKGLQSRRFDDASILKARREVESRHPQKTKKSVIDIETAAVIGCSVSRVEKAKGVATSNNRP